MSGQLAGMELPNEPNKSLERLAPITPIQLSKTRISLLNFAAQQELEDVQNNIGYSPRLLAQVSLPYRDPGDIPSWTRTNGNVSIVMRPLLRRNNETGTDHHAYAYGLIPRQALTFFATEAVRTHDRTIKLGSSMREFMTKIGLQSNGRDAARLTDQLNRLLGSNLRVEGLFTHDLGHVEKARQFLISDSSELWFGKDQNLETTNGGLFMSEITLSETFYESIIAAPVPVNLNALKALGSSPMRLDILLWASYRVFQMSRPQSMRWSELNAQFGGQYAQARQFKAKFLENLSAVSIIYPELNYEITPDFLVLKPSKPHVDPRKRRAELI